MIGFITRVVKFAGQALGSDQRDASFSHHEVPWLASNWDDRFVSLFEMIVI